MLPEDGLHVFGQAEVLLQAALVILRGHEIGDERREPRGCFHVAGDLGDRFAEKPKGKAAVDLIEGFPHRRKALLSEGVGLVQLLGGRLFSGRKRTP